MNERDINWLSKEDAFEVGVQSERERIIKLLKSVDDELGIFGVGWTMQEIAELIKEENE